MNVEDRIRAELADLEARSQLRRLDAHGNDFCSNDYLGLAGDPRLKAALLAAVNIASRVGATGSRLLSGHDDAWDALEGEFARWVGTEAALYFTSGYAANIGLLSTILHEEDVVFSDSANHASLIDGIRLSKARRVIFPHRDLDALENELRRAASEMSASSARFIVTESIFSMDGDRAPLRELLGLAQRYGAEVIVDEAHAIGVAGPHGAGCLAETQLTGRVFAMVHTCGKALASAGAFVCGSESLRQVLINRARTFIFNTGLPPYFAAQISAAMQLARDATAERAQLARSSNFLRTRLRENGFDIAGSTSHIVPVVLGSNHSALAFASQLELHGYRVRPIRPPTVPRGTARLRLSLTANIPDSLLADFADAIIQSRKELAVAEPPEAGPVAVHGRP